MAHLQKILLIAAVIFLCICLGATIWAAVVTQDPSFYIYAAIFVLAIIWFSITIYKSYKRK